MTIVVILNIVLAAFVVLGIVGLLSWGIVSSRDASARLLARRTRTARTRDRNRALFPGRATPAYRIR